MSVVIIKKRVGETPLAALERYRSRYKKLKGEKMAYAGRLDPMAEGKLILLIGEDTKKRDKYQSADKEYVFRTLLGVSTDTFDMLGMVAGGYIVPTGNNIEKARKFVENLAGKRRMNYPPYSSKTVDGKKLFVWAREGRIDEIDIPKREVKVYESDYLGTETIEKESLEKEIVRRIGLVKGDFRQREILSCWDDFFSRNSEKKFVLMGVRVKCSSGTYVRGLVNEMGEHIGIGATTYSINRTAVDLG